MRLVGASNWFIRAPFILEGIMQSLVGALLAILVLVSFQSFALPKIKETISFMTFTMTGGTTAQISLVLVLSGILIGSFGSWLAMRKYLKV